MQCSLSTRTWHFRGISYMLHVPYCCGWAMFAFNPVIYNGSFCLLWIGFIPCLVNKSLWATLGLSWVRPGIWQSCNCTLLQDIQPVLSSGKLSLLERTCIPTRCLPTAHCWTCSLIDMCGFLPLSLGQDSLWSGVGSFQDCLHKALWMYSYQGWVGRGESAEKCRGRTFNVSKVCSSLLLEET